MAIEIKEEGRLLFKEGGKTMNMREINGKSEISLGHHPSDGEYWNYRLSAEEEEELRKFLNDRAKTPDQALWDQFTDHTKAVAGHLGLNMAGVVEYLSTHLKVLYVPQVLVEVDQPTANISATLAEENGRLVAGIDKNPFWLKYEFAEGDEEKLLDFLMGRKLSRMGGNPRAPLVRRMVELAMEEVDYILGK